jgi:hypothetical protein
MNYQRSLPRFTRRALLVASTLTFASIAWFAPTEAQACGGTFCDTGPNVMPVDQTGENILFVREGAMIEAHIQIQYDGDPERFAWVIPVSTEPEITVGSQALFDALLASTVPTFGTSQSFDCTDNGGGGPAFGCGGFADDVAAGSSGEGFNDGGEEGGDDGGGPDIVARGVAGAFEYVVLSGGTVEGVVDWLDAEGYQQDDDAPPLLQNYLDKDYMFVAVKLVSGAGIEEIQPLVLRYEGDEECIPIVLTAIAAKEDMAIRAFFAGEERSVPTNYELVEPNWARLDWGNFGDNYNELVSLAVDEAEGGRGWVTEYAGNIDVVPTAGLLGPTWTSLVFVDTAAIDVVDLLRGQGLMECNSTDGCTYNHPLVEPLLNQFLPVPDGVSDDAFYACLECHEALIDTENWDGQAFADAFGERIVEPGKRAEEILEDHDYLTRLFTTLSPHEMTVDPTFHTNPDLGDYASTQVAVQHIECEEPDWMELPDGSEVHHDSDNAYPDLMDLPAAMATYNVPAMGGAQQALDNADAIADGIKDWNRANPLHGEGNDCSVNSSARKQGLISFACLLALMGIRRRRED